jgi:hypothetical protein
MVATPLAPITIVPPTQPVVPPPIVSAPLPAYTSSYDSITSTNTGVIIGVVFGALACISFLTAGIAFVIHRRRKEQQAAAAAGGDNDDDNAKKKTDLEGGNGDNNNNNGSSGSDGSLSPNLLLPSFLPPSAILMTNATDSHLSVHAIENLNEEEEGDGERGESIEVVDQQGDVVVMMERGHHHHHRHSHIDDDQTINPLLPSSFPPPNILTHDGTITTDSGISNTYYNRTDTSAASTDIPTAPPLESVLITPTTTTRVLLLLLLP